MTEQTATTSPGVTSGRLIYGCMGLGGTWSDDPHDITDVETAAEAVEAAMDIGVTLFDHADIYRNGKSETVFGEVLATTTGLRERIQLQTKCGIRLNERGLETHYDLSSDAIIERVNGSLERLRTDYVDILLKQLEPLLSRPVQNRESQVRKVTKQLIPPSAFQRRQRRYDQQLLGYLSPTQVVVCPQSR